MLWLWKGWHHILLKTALVCIWGFYWQIIDYQTPKHCGCRVSPNHFHSTPMHGSCNKGFVFMSCCVISNGFHSSSNYCLDLENIKFMTYSDKAFVIVHKFWRILHLRVDGLETKSLTLEPTSIQRHRIEFGTDFPKILYLYYLTEHFYLQLVKAFETSIHPYTNLHLSNWSNKTQFLFSPATSCIHEDTKMFPGQQRLVVSPACPGSA